jgi:microcystin-dependent protein
LGLTGTAEAQPQPFIGEVMIFAGNYCPKGWAIMDGQLLPINQYQPLFQILGTNYGGDGLKTFALPKAKPFKTAGDKQTLMQCIALFGVFPTQN